MTLSMNTVELVWKLELFQYHCIYIYIISIIEYHRARMETRALPIPLYIYIYIICMSVKTDELVLKLKHFQYHCQIYIYIYVYIICLSVNTTEAVWKLEHFQSMYALKPQFYVLSLITQFYPSKPAKSKSPRVTVTVSAGNSASHSRHDENITEPQMCTTLCTYIPKSQKQIRLESARTIQIPTSRKDSCVH